MKRGRPVHAFGSTPRKDHLFEDQDSLCGGWWYGGGREVDPTEVEMDDDLCVQCARKLQKRLGPQDA